MVGNTLPPEGGLFPVPPPPAELAILADGMADRLLVLPRAAIGLAALPVMFLVPILWSPGIGLVGGYLLAVSALTALALRRRPESLPPHRLALVVLLADTVAWLAVLILLGATPYGAGMLLFPLLAFEAVFKYGGRGMVFAFVGLVLGIGARMTWRVWQYGLMPRWHVALTIAAATGVLVGLAFALRTRYAAEAGARAEKERIAASLRATVAELLARSGVPLDSIIYADLQRLLLMACDQPELGRELGRRLAHTLDPSSDLARLTPREQEIIYLLAEGLTDRQVAARLFLSGGTIRVHVSHIVRKLGLPNRSAALNRARAARAPMAALRPAPPDRDTALDDPVAWGTDDPGAPAVRRHEATPRA